MSYLKMRPCYGSGSPEKCIECDNENIAFSHPIGFNFEKVYWCEKCSSLWATKNGNPDGDAIVIGKWWA